MFDVLPPASVAAEYEDWPGPWRYGGTRTYDHERLEKPHDTRSGESHSGQFQAGRADIRASGRFVLWTAVRNRSRRQAAVSRRHDGARPQADGDARRRGQQLDKLEAILPAASALAKRHVDYGVKAEDYTPVGAALLWTLEQGLGKEWTRNSRKRGAPPMRSCPYMIGEAYGRSVAAE